MDEAYRTQALAEAIAERDAARARMNAARVGSKTWRAAGQDLDFWMGKVAALSHYYQPREV